jgi:lysyl-tRNA synthetase class 2
MNDFAPTASLETLRLRASLLAKVREFFAAQGFLEVETPLLSADVAVDLHLDPIPVVLAGDVRTPEIGRRLWLQTSPEFGMKRLLAAGAQAIYQITRAFRNAETGARHNPEFTMVEWYRVGDDMQAGMERSSQLCQALLNTVPAKPLSYSAAFEQFAGIEPHTASAADLLAAAKRSAIEVPQGVEADRDGLLNLLLAECVEPRLGKMEIDDAKQSASVAPLRQPIILYDYPATQAALAKTRAGPPPVAERFELYVNGIELANGYHELLDPAELRRRNRIANAARVAARKPPLPEESRLLAAMDAGLPPCTGVALGFDRIVMLAAGVKTIREVLAFPIDRA